MGRKRRIEDFQAYIVGRKVQKSKFFFAFCVFMLKLHWN
jgi:hypothetical protein